MTLKKSAAERGSIYFLECGDFIKIGFSATVARRVRSLAASNPYDVKLLCSSYAAKNFEGKLHAQFAHLRHRAEWFRKAPELLELIKNLSPWVPAKENIGQTPECVSLETGISSD